MIISTTYEANRYTDGYDSDFTANTQNSEGTYQFNANSSMFDATTDENSNGRF